MKKNKRSVARPILALVIIIIIIAVAGILVWKFYPKNSEVGKPVYAPKGQLTPQFPKELILDTTVAVNNSCAINYSPTLNQYTAEYDSSNTVKALFADYQSYLSKNGWTITSTLTTRPMFDALNATKGTEQLQVVVSTRDKGSHIIITVVVK